MGNFIYGFFYPFKCIKLFFKFPKLIGFSIVPMIINLIIYGAIFFYTYNWITNVTGSFIENNISNRFLFDLIETLLKIFYFLLILVICYFLFIIFGGIISAPFNEKISTFIEEKIFNEKTNVKMTLWQDISLSIKAELKKLLFYFSIMIPLLLIEFIPMIGGVITLVLGTGFSFFYNALDYLDYPLTRRMIDFKQKLKITGSEKLLSFGFGAMATILTFVPLVNVIFKPVLVASGTSLFYEKGYYKLIHDDNSSAV